MEYYCIYILYGGFVGSDSIFIVVWCVEDVFNMFYLVDIKMKFCL